MKLNIEHSTRYTFNKPLGYTIQELRLTPQDGFGQRVKNWQVKVSGHTTQHTDAFGNIAQMLVIDSPHHELMITASGEVETDLDLPPIDDFLALPIYLRNTKLTKPDGEIKKFANSILTQGDAVNITSLTVLMNEIVEQVKWTKDADENKQSAIEAFAAKAALSQGLAHAFIACCRGVRVPARLVHGYCFNSSNNQLEHHSWADVWLIGHGWQSFDVANNCKSNGVHVRLATGLDYRDACPVSRVVSESDHSQLSLNFKVQALTQMQQ